MTQLHEKLNHFINTNFLFSDKNSELDESQSFLDSGIVDSAGIMEIVLFVEDNFKIDVDDEELLPQNFDSINGLATYINSKKPGTFLE